MQKLLTLQDLLPILRVSEATLRRWLAETRKGMGNFPKPINGFKRKLLFHPDEIERWMNSGQSPPPVIESSSQRKKRHAAACLALQKHGINVPVTPNEHQEA